MGLQGLTREERRERASKLVAELSARRGEAGLGLRTAWDLGLSVRTVRGWFLERGLDAGRLFEGKGGAWVGKKKERAQKRLDRLEEWGGRCGATGDPCPMSATCMYGGEALVASERSGNGSFAKIDSCAIAVANQILQCKSCPLKKLGKPCAWRCWKKEPAVAAMCEERVWAPQRRADRREEWLNPI